MTNTKTALRKEARNLVKVIKDKPIVSDAIVRNILSLQQWKTARQVFLFLPFPSEPDITALIDQALQQGKEVGIPICEAGTHMYFSALDSDWKQTLKGGLHGTTCPTNCSKEMKPLDQDSSLMLVPGVLFSTKGARLGRGGGYYDTYLATWHDKLMTIGICHSTQIKHELPTEDHDQLVDIVVTEKNVLFCAGIPQP